MSSQTPAPGRRIGQGMWIVFWCLLLAALVAWFSDVEEQRYYPNQQLNSQVTDHERQVLLSANRFGHYTLPGRINSRDVRFLIDTGATDVVIPGAQASALGLSAGRRSRVRTANGEIDVFRTRIDRLELGPIVLTNVPASVNPHMDGEILLGMSALKSLELNQRNQQLILTQRLP